MALYANGTIWVSPKLGRSRSGPSAWRDPKTQTPTGLPQTPFAQSSLASLIESLGDLPGALVEDPSSPGAPVPSGPRGVFLRAPTLARAVELLLKMVSASPP